MVPRRCSDLQDIAHSNCHWNERKTRVNIVLTAALLLALFGVLACL